MVIFHRRQREEVDQLVEDYTRQGFSRRAFIQRAMALGFSFSSATALLTACGGQRSSSSSGNPIPTSIDVLNVWGADEQASFKAVVEPFTRDTKIAVNIESTRDLDAVLTTRIRGNNPPDIAVLPNPGKMRLLAGQNKLIRLDQFLDMTKIHSDYSRSWIDLGSYNGGLYALVYKLANKGTVWYNPTQVQAIGAQIPSTWSDLITLSDKIASGGKYPWSLGVESAAASGWPWSRSVPARSR